MFPFNSQRTQFPAYSSLSSLYPYLFRPLTQTSNQFLTNSLQMNFVDSYYNSLFLQHTQRLLENALFYQNQKERSQPNQFWQDLMASLTNSKFKDLSSDDGRENSESQLQPQLKPSETGSVSIEAATASLNQNLESSAIAKAKHITFTKHQKMPKNSKVASNDSSDRNTHNVICKIEAEQESNKRIKANHEQSRNQLEPHPPKNASFIGPLDPDDCAFDSNNDEPDFEHAKWFNAENEFMSNSTQEQQQQEESKQKTYVLAEKNVDPHDNKDRECQMLDEKVKVEFDGHELLENDLEDLNSSFSSDDWPSLSEDVEFQIL